ncbi:MAG: hypothetical protein ACP5QG_05185 [candidate division WOR-3 bacterium]
MNPLLLSAIVVPAGLAWLVFRLIRSLPDERIAWAIEKANPSLAESLISWVELRTSAGKDILSMLTERIIAAKPSARRVFRIKPMVLTVVMASASLLCLRVGLSPHDFLAPRGAVGFIFPEKTTFFCDDGTVLSIVGKPDGARVILVGPEKKEFLAQPRMETGRLTAGRYTAILVAKGDTLSQKNLLAVERPYLKGIKVWLKQPATLGGRETEIDEPVSLTGHQGGTIQISIEHTGDSAVLIWKGKPLSGMTLSLEEDGVLEIALKNGPLWTKSPRKLEIGVIPDNPPTVRMVQPESDVYLPDDERVPVIVQAEDDIGLRSVLVLWELKGTKGSAAIPIRPGAADVSGQATVSLSGMDMLPGDEALVWAEATDTRGQKSITPSLRVRFPSMEEIFGLSASTSESASEKAGDLKAQAEALTQKMQEVNDILKSSKDLSWEERQRIERALSEAQELAQEVSRATQEMSAEFQELSQLPNYDPELLEKFAEVQKLMSEVMTDELWKSLEELQRAMASLDKKAVEEAFKNFQLNQEELKRRLERTEELLKRYAQEIRMQELAAEAERLATEQEALERETGIKGPGPELLQKQQRLAEQIENLREKAEKLGAELSAAGEQEGKLLKDISENELSEAASDAREASQQLSQGNKNKAQQNQSSAAQALKKAASSLGSATFSLTDRRKEEIIKALAILRQEVIFVSGQVPGMHDILDQNEFRARAKAMADAVKAARDRLDEIAKMTALIPPKIYAYLLGSQRLFEFMTEGQRVNPDEAMAELNLVALALFETQQECQCAGSSTGMTEAMKKLAEMARAQSEMNSQTQSLLQMFQQGGITPDMAGQRLLAMAAEQEALRRQIEALRQAIQNNPDAKGLQQALEGAQEEMEKVEDLLRQKRLDEELLKKQQSIYTRLLEAQQSIKKQEFNPQRESETAKPFTGVPPKPSDREQIRKSLLQSVRGEEFWRYPPEMQKLIKAYYRTLLEY